jgi:hypothetical protein
LLVANTGTGSALTRIFTPVPDGLTSV